MFTYKQKFINKIKITLTCGKKNPISKTYYLWLKIQLYVKKNYFIIQKCTKNLLISKRILIYYKKSLLCKQNHY